MTVTQVYTLVNTCTQEVLGKTAPAVAEDLSNVVDMGTAIQNANAVDAYTKSLVNHIGRVIFVNRVYQGGTPKVLMDGWEYGSVCEKISGDMPEASETEDWELEDGTSYDPNIFTQPQVEAKFFNKKVTFQVDLSITTLQVKQSFSSPSQLNSFLSFLYNEVEKSLTVKIDALVMRTIDNMIAETYHADYAANPEAGSSGVKCINLLYLYNQLGGTALTAAQALTNMDFLKFATCEIGKYPTRMSKISTLFNVGGKARFTPNDVLHTILLTDFAKAADVYLQASTYHNEMVKLPEYEEVPYWQGSGTGYKFEDTGKITIKTAAGNTVAMTGVIGVMFDRDALGVANLDRRVTTQYNAKAEFYNSWYKFDAGYFNDLNENMVVFVIA